ncbi:MAG TPA: peptide chain release factor 1 [Acidimicrobiia bacterium]
MDQFLEAGLIARLQEMATALSEVEAEMASGNDRDPNSYAELGKRHADLARPVGLFRRFQEAAADYEEAEALSRSEPEFAAMAEEKASEATRLAEELKAELSPADPNDQKDVIIEVRAAAGGDEAAIWAGDLLRMYERYADRHGFRTEPMESSESEAGGFSRVTVAVKGKGAYSRFKYEGGVHRVQRVPKTEGQGRIHTSTATVAVLPEATEVEVEVDPNDVRVDVFRSTGPGGQSVNTTDSAVRLTHVPTGLVVTCQDEKSQLQNKEKAFRILRARLYQMKMEEQQAELSGARRAQVGTGGRSEKIRTYNFKESRVTDHRIGLTVRRLDQVLEGDLDELVAGMSNQ